MISVDRLFISAVLIFPGLTRANSTGSATAIALVMTICPAVSIAAGGAAGGDDIAVVKLYMLNNGFLVLLYFLSDIITLRFLNKKLSPKIFPALVRIIPTGTGYLHPVEMSPGGDGIFTVIKCDQITCCL